MEVAKNKKEEYLYIVFSGDYNGSHLHCQGGQ